MLFVVYLETRSLWALRALTSRWGPFGLGHLDFVLHALQALRPYESPKDDHNLLSHLYFMHVSMRDASKIHISV